MERSRHRARELNIPLEAFVTENGCGTFNEKSFFTLDKSNVIIDAVKKAQDENGIIVRVYEAEGKHSDVYLSLPFKGIKVTDGNLMEENASSRKSDDAGFMFSIKPFEVLTFRIEF